MNIKSIKNLFIGSKLFKDAFWAVFGNGMGNAMMLLAGIFIARLLGKDLYGEYGIVKSTMFYVASFATFGLGFTSTKYIAQYMTERKQYVKSIVRDSMTITLAFSGTIAILLIIFAQHFADYVEAPSLKLAFQALAGVIVFKAMTTTQIGLLSGFKEFKGIARNSVASSVFLLVSCIPFTYFYSLKGSLLALLSSQAFNMTINYFSLRKLTQKLPDQENKTFKKELILFSFPVALQESSFTVCHLLTIMFLTKFSSASELGLYSAGAQWNSVIMMIPVLLNNVVLSHLSGNASNKTDHHKTVKMMLLVNLICTLIPFIVVYILADFIANFYGPTFYELPALLRIVIFSTIFECCSSVFKSELMSQGRTWLLFSLRCIRDVALVVLVYIVMVNTNGVNGALSYAWISVAITALFFFLMFVAYRLTTKKDIAK